MTETRFPSTSGRTHLVRDLTPGCKATIAGRLIGTTLRDASGDVRVTLPTGWDPQERAIVELEGQFESDGTFSTLRATLLTPSHGPFPMRDRLRDVAHIRAKALALTRSFFADNGFIEVDTPIFMRESTFNIHIGEFTTQWKNPPNTAELFLHSSPEHYMKRLLVSGVDKIYQLVHFFRNGQGELGPHHQPEFMGLEFYEAFKDYSDIMGSTERFVRHLAQGLDGAILREEPFERLRVEDAFKRYADLDLGAARTVDSLREAATRCGILTNPDDAYDDLFFRVFIEKIESNLGRDRPTFLYDYPLSMAVMAKASAAHPHLAERVELYINGVELANGFTEENNAEIQRARFVADRRVIDPSGRAPLDEAFLGALAHGMPPAAGIAIGFDRLLMVLLGKKTIADVLPFPL